MEAQHRNAQASGIQYQRLTSNIDAVASTDCKLRRYESKTTIYHSDIGNIKLYWDK